MAISYHEVDRSVQKLPQYINWDNIIDIFLV